MPENTPPLYRKNTPKATKARMMPMHENHTMHPTKHLSKNIYTRLITTAIPIPQRSHLQFYIMGVITFYTSDTKFPKEDPSSAVVREVMTVDSPLAMTADEGTQSLFMTPVVSYPKK